MIKINITRVKIRNSETLQGIIHMVDCGLRVGNETIYKSFNLPTPKADSFVPLDQVTDDLIEQWITPHIRRQRQQILSEVRSRKMEDDNIAMRVVDPEGKSGYAQRESKSQWRAGLDFTEGDTIYYNETKGKDPIIEMYEVIKAHKSTGKNKPDSAPDLYKLIL